MLNHQCVIRSPHNQVVLFTLNGPYHPFTGTSSLKPFSEPPPLRLLPVAKLGRGLHEFAEGPGVGPNVLGLHLLVDVAGPCMAPRVGTGLPSQPKKEWVQATQRKLAT